VLAVDVGLRLGLCGTDEIDVDDRYRFGDYLRALASQARAPRNRGVVIWLGVITVAGFAAFWVFRGPVVAALVVGGITVISLPLGYVRVRNLRRRREP